MSDLNLTPFNPLYPMRVHQYDELFNDQNQGVPDKINSIIDYLNKVGKLTNDVVKDWNTVYQWVMNDGLTTDVNNKLEAMLANHEFDSIIDALATKVGDLNTLTTSAKDTIVNAINSLQTAVTANTTNIATNTANIATNTANIATNTANIASNTSALAQNAAQLQSDAWHPEQSPYNAKGDGVTDDTTALTSFVNDCISKGKPMELNGKYKITSPITVNGNGGSVNFRVNGYVIPSNSGFVFQNIIGGNIEVRLIGGGDNTLNSIGVKTSNVKGIKLNVYGDAYHGLLLKNGGNKQDGTDIIESNTSLIARNGCLQALQHGDSISGKYQDGYGTYDYIYDFDSLNGIQFQNSNDITIKHLENHFYDTTNTKDGVTVNNCGATHCENIAIGGRAKSQINIINSRIDFVKLYTVNEDPSTKISNGCTIDNLSLVLIHYFKDSNSNNGINIPTTGSTVKISNIYAGGTLSVVNVGGTDQGISTGFYAGYSSNPYLYSGVVKPLKNGANNWFQFQSADGTKNHYFLGENVSDNSFRIESYDQGTGAWLGDPIYIDNTGNIRVGMNATSKVGFFGNTGAVKQTVTGAKGSNTALGSLITALVNMGIITDNTTT